jgi:hypothetical protein
MINKQDAIAKSHFSNSLEKDPSPKDAVSEHTYIQ